MITTILAFAIFLVLTFSMAMTTGTLSSMSALAKQWRWLLLAALWSLILLLPQMFDMTTDNWKWMPFIGIFCVTLCGGATIFNKADERIHMIAAAVAFVLLTGWVMLIDSKYLMPLIICLMLGRENIIWRAEAGLIASVYTLMLILN